MHAGWLRVHVRELITTLSQPSRHIYHSTLIRYEALLGGCAITVPLPQRFAERLSFPAKYAISFLFSLTADGAVCERFNLSQTAL